MSRDCLRSQHMERLREMISVMEELIFDIEESIDAIARFERQRNPFLLECPLSVRNLETRRANLTSTLETLSRLVDG